VTPSVRIPPIFIQLGETNTSAAALCRYTVPKVIRPRIAIVDDHTLFNIALGKLLEPDFHVVGTYSSVGAFLAQAEQLDPDIVILDVAMPSISGLEAAREVRRRLPRARFIFVTASEDPDVAAEAYAVGASAFVLKRSAGTELQSAIRAVMRDRNSVAPSSTTDRIDAAPPAAAIHTLNQQVTPRQREVLRLLAAGRSMKEAAAILNVSVRTVAFHKYRMMRQLNLKSSAALIQFAVRERIV
jgi:DNA-binding NarL/FixJ family response regulator